MDIQMIWKFVLTVLSAILTTFLIPYLKERYDNQKLAQAVSWVRIAVRSAEQIYNESGVGPQKKAYVISFMNKKGIKIDEEKLNAMIEATVFEMNQALKQLEDNKENSVESDTENK